MRIAHPWVPALFLCTFVGAESAFDTADLPSNCRCESERQAYNRADKALATLHGQEEDLERQVDVYKGRPGADLNGAQFRALIRQLEDTRLRAEQAYAQVQAVARPLKAKIDKARADAQYIVDHPDPTDPDHRSRQEQAKLDVSRAAEVSADLDEDIEENNQAAQTRVTATRQAVVGANQAAAAQGTGAGQKPGQPPAAPPQSPEAQRAAQLKASAVQKSDAGNRLGACADAKGALGAQPGDAHAAGMAKLLCGGGVMDSAALQRLMDAKARKPGAQADGSRPDELKPQSRATGTAGISNKEMPPPPADNSKLALLRTSGAVPDSKVFTSDALQSLRTGNYRESLDSARRAIEMEPGSARNYQTYAAAAAGMKNYGAVLEGASAGLRLAADNGALLKMKSYAQGRLRDYKGALESADAALALNPSDASAHANRAWALAGLGDRDGMLRSLRKAAALDPRYESSLQSALDRTNAGDEFFLFPGEEAPEGGSKGGDRRRTYALIGLAGLAVLTVLALLWARIGADEEPNA